MRVRAAIQGSLHVAVNGARVDLYSRLEEISMLTREANERLTRVGPGTPMGNLLRRYWHAIAAAAQLETEPVLPVKILG